MKTLIIPTDFSPASTNALHYASALAQDLEASLLIVHVFQVPVSMTEVPVAALSIDDIKANAEERLNLLKESVAHLYPKIQKVYAEALMGDVKEELNSLFIKIAPLAIVMGSHGSSNLEHFFMGSTTLTLIRNTTVPVFIIPPGVSYRRIHKIGLACDMKAVVDTFPLATFMPLLKALNAHLYVLHVSEEKPSEQPSLVLENAYVETMFEGVSHEYQFIQEADITEGIQKFAENNNLDLIAMIPKKHTWSELIFQKSTAASMIQQTHIPLLSIQSALHS